MKTFLSLGLCVALFVTASHGQIGGGAPVAGARLTVGQVEELVAPIALYPDPLIAIILPAATQPSDIVLAARYLERGGNPDAANNEPWDESVKALLRYREVLEYLDENLEWTRTLGEAFLDQRDVVMASVQTLRARARTNGLLSSTPQQEVIEEAEEIRIVPAQPTVIYVPRYDPEILYVRHIHSYPTWHRPFITFGIGYGVGWWLSYDCDWRYRTVHVVHRPSYWYHRPDWRIRYWHRDRYPDHRWTHWSPRHDRHNHYYGSRSSTTVVLRPNRDWERTRHSRIEASATRESPVSRPATAPVETRWRDDRPSRSSPREFHDGRYDGRRRERPPEVVRSSGASVAAVSPSVPTAPTVVTTPPPQIPTRPVAETRRHDPRPRPESGGGEWRGRGHGAPRGEAPRATPPANPPPREAPRREPEPSRERRSDVERPSHRADREAR